MKTALTILIVLISTTLSFGQNFSVGSEIGIISSSYTHYKIYDLESRRNTYYTGLNLHYKFDNRLSFTTGLHYLRQGERGPKYYNFKQSVEKIDYLAVPFLTNIHLLKSRKLVFSFGLLGAYNIKAIEEPRELPEEHAWLNLSNRDLSDYTRKRSISGIAGLGYKIYENEKFELISSIKYYHGFTNTYNSPDNPMKIKRKYSSAVMTINFNYKL